MTTQPPGKPPARPPDLIVFEVLHRAMRTDAARLASTVTRLHDRDRDQARAIARWYAGFSDQLSDHHHIEDEVFFPVLAARVPTFADLSDRIDQDHDRLDQLLADTEGALDGLAEPRRWHVAYDSAVDATVALRDVLGTHLDIEDRDVLPMFLRHFTAEEYDEVEQRARRIGSPSKLLFMVPWLLEAAAPDEKARLFGKAPTAFKLLWFASRHRYERLTRRALASAAAEARATDNGHKEVA